MPDLGLQAQAEQHFSFLIWENGYRCIESTPYRVRFESSTMFVEIVFDGNRSYELGLLVGQAASSSRGQPPLSIDEILRFRRAPEAESFSLLQVTTSEALAALIEELARLLRIYGSDLVAGNKLSFAALLRQRHTEVERYAVERGLRAARVEAEAAWLSKDYTAVIRALEPFRTALTESEIKKLNFCKKQQKKG
jgi:hypothetical protein